MCDSKSGTVTWLLGDHLGSTSLSVSEGGMTIAEAKYTPWGDQRTLAGDLPTDYAYTGQREESVLGLMYYVARWYDSGIGHFVQADTVVPGAGNPAAWNRYAYVMYNPVKFVDPSGHQNSCPPGLPIGDWCAPDTRSQQEVLEQDYGFTFEGNWTNDELKTIMEAVLAIQTYINGLSLGISGSEWIRKYLGTNFAHGTFLNDGVSNYVMNGTMYLTNNFSKNNVIHEFGHVLDNNIGYSRQDATRTIYGPGGQVINVEGTYFDATLYGGGLADDLFTAMSIGGILPASGIRGCNGSCQYLGLGNGRKNWMGVNAFLAKDNKYDSGQYANYSSADYFAETFMFMVIGNPSAGPNLVNWMQTNVFIKDIQ